jgi:hypothetical protein
MYQINIKIIKQTKVWLIIPCKMPLAVEMAKNLLKIIIYYIKLYGLDY